MKKRKLFNWVAVAMGIVVVLGIWSKLFSLDAMISREGTMLGYLYTWVWMSHEGTEKELDEFMEKYSPEFYLTNQVFTFNGSSIVARFAFSSKVDDKQLLSSADYLFFWVNRSGKIVRGPKEIVPLKKLEQRIYSKRETVQNMKNFIEGWMRESYVGTEEKLCEFLETNSSDFFLVNRAFNSGGSNVVARFASSHKVDGEELVVSADYLFFWVDSAGKGVGFPFEMKELKELEQGYRDRGNVSK